MKYVLIFCLFLCFLGCKENEHVYPYYDPAEKGYFIGTINEVYYKMSDIDILQNDANGIYVVARGTSVNRKAQIKIRCENKVQSKTTNTTDTNILVIEKIGNGSEIAYQIDGAIKLFFNDKNGLKIGVIGISSDKRLRVGNSYFWK